MSILPLLCPYFNPPPSYRLPEEETEGQRIFLWLSIHTAILPTNFIYQLPALDINMVLYFCQLNKLLKVCQNKLPCFNMKILGYSGS